MLNQPLTDEQLKDRVIEQASALRRWFRYANDLDVGLLIVLFGLLHPERIRLRGSTDRQMPGLVTLCDEGSLPSLTTVWFLSPSTFTRPAPKYLLHHNSRTCESS
jgi:hypothetical protein